MYTNVSVKPQDTTTIHKKVKKLNNDNCGVKSSNCLSGRTTFVPFFKSFVRDLAITLS